MHSATLLQARHHPPEFSYRPGPDTTRPRRILIDCTPTYRHDCGTGVQRVVRNLVNWAESAGREMQIECRGVAYDATCGFRVVDAFPGAPRPAPPPGGAQVVSGRSAFATLPRRISLIKSAARRTLSATGLLNPARRVNRALRRTLAPVRQAVERRRRLRSLVHPGSGDVLLLTDTIWNTPEVWDGARLAVSRGAKLGAVVYDLIPLRYSDLYGADFPRIFAKWFENVVGLADFTVCISRSAWEDVRAYLAAQDALAQRARPLVGGWFRLGAGLDTRPTNVAVRRQLRELFGNEHLDNPYLVVGSFDPRKDLPTIVRAFERLWAGGSPYRLVTIGRGVPGQAGPLEQLVRHHPQHGQRLFCFSDVEDAELDFCYCRSASLITASYAEGFNLPIVESLSRGRGVLASDLPVHHEVAGACASYFPPRCAEALADLVLRHQRGQLPGVLECVEGFRWPDWPESTRDLLERVVELYSATDACRQPVS